MMINQNIIKFFGYEKKELLGTLIISAIFVFRNHDKNNRLLDKILIASKIDLEAPLFLKELEEQLNLLKNNKEENEILFASILKHSPSILQNSTITWTYYAIYFAFNLKDGNIFISKDEKVLSEILNLPLELHYNYLKYKELEEKEGLQKNERQQEYFFKDITIGVVRTLEYLAKFYLSKNEHLFNTYLYNIEDHYKNLVELANNDIIESSCFFIVHDPISNNFLKYENAEFGIHYQVLSSRKITTGASTGEEFNSKITN